MGQGRLASLAGVSAPTHLQAMYSKITDVDTILYHLVLSTTGSSRMLAFKQGTFSWYVEWRYILFVLIFVRETKGMTWSSSTMCLMSTLSRTLHSDLRQVPFYFKKFALFENRGPKQLFELESES
jgi:hypothetical protein